MHPIFADIAVELEAIGREVATLRDALARVPGDPVIESDPTWRALALAGIGSKTEKVYTGIEKVLVPIAAELDGHVPSDGAWPVTLLRRMAPPLDGVRPRILDEALLARLDRLRGFRHRERTLYSHDLRAPDVLEMAALACDAADAFAGAIDRLRRLCDG